jgi:Asp-tRNA(Asn)/Glu-tRNA(Gln) amidotransferase A subunit family amidase
MNKQRFLFAVLCILLSQGQVSVAHAGAPSFQVFEASIPEVHAALRQGKTSCQTIVSQYLLRIQTYDKALQINSIQTINARAQEQAKALDALQAKGGWGGALHCVPVMLKDVFETKDMPTSFGSVLFKHWTSDRDAAVVQRLKNAGAIILAKNTMGEFGNRYSGSAYGLVRNPYDITRNPSGSSAGTAASLTANFGLVGIGEDSTGSIRGPASVNNLVGLRPTHGSVNLAGMMPATPSVDTLGPITRTTKDAAILMEVIADARGGQSIAEVSNSAPLRVGVITQPISASTDPGSSDYYKVHAVFDQALKRLKNQNVTVITPLNPAELSLVRELEAMNFDAYETEKAMDEHLRSMNKPPVSSLRELLDSGVVVPAAAASLRKALGKRTTDPAYATIQRKRQLLRDAVLKSMSEHNLSALVYATYDHQTTPIPDDVLTNPQSKDTFGWGDNRNLSPATGLPALSVPAGLTTDRLPVGMEFIGAPYSESILLELGRRLEQSSPSRQVPGLTPPLQAQ